MSSSSPINMMKMDLGTPLSPNETLQPRKKPGRSIFIGHKMSLHLITEDFGSEEESSSEEEEIKVVPPGIVSSPPGIVSINEQPNTSGTPPPGLDLMDSGKKLEDVKEEEEDVGTEDMPSLGVAANKKEGPVLNSTLRKNKKEHRRSMARIRRSSQTLESIPTFGSAGKKASRRASQVRRVSVSLKKKIRRRSSAAVLKRKDVEKLKEIEKKKQEMKNKARRKSTIEVSSTSSEIKLPQVDGEKKKKDEEKIEDNNVDSDDEDAKDWLKCNDRLGQIYYLNMSTREKEWVRPHERVARRQIDRSERVSPPGLKYFDKTAAVDSDDDYFSDEEDLEPVPEITDMGDGGHHSLLPPRTQEFSKVFGILRLSRDEIDAMLPAVHVREYGAGKIILEGQACESTVVICRHGELRAVRSGKNRAVFGRSSGQKYSKFHKGDCYGALHVKKKDTKRLETTEDSEVLILEHEAIAKCIVDKIKILWEEYQKNERQRRLQIKLRKQAILQNKHNKRRARDANKSKRRGSQVGHHGHHGHHQRRASKHVHSKSDFADSQMDGRDSRKSFINSLLKGGGGGSGGRHNTRGPSMRKMSVRRSQHRRASKRMSISIVSEHEQRERSGSKFVNHGDDERSSSSPSSPEKNRKGSASSHGSKEEVNSNTDTTDSNTMLPKQDEPISSKDMSFEDAMAASNRAEAQNLRTIEYISNYSERMLMEEEDNIMQIIHEKDVQANRAKRRRLKEQSHKNMMMQKQQQQLQKKAKQIQSCVRKEKKQRRKERRERLQSSVN